MATPPAAPASDSAQATSPAVPWWVPPWPVFLAAGLYVMAFWILYLLSPVKGQEPSETFKMLAQAIVLTAFVNGVVATSFASSRDSQKKNETIATQARMLAGKSTASE